jgi:hypothetical protein
MFHSEISEVDMRTILIGLMLVVGVLIGVGTAAADSNVTYPDNTVTEAISLGCDGCHAFVAIDNPGDGDIFIHPVNFFGNLLFVQLGNTSAFSGFAIWLDFRGFSGSFRVYDVYVCSGSQTSCSFNFRGQFFL